MNLHFLSSETTELLNAQVLWMANWKWITIFALVFGGLALRVGVRWLVRRLKIRWLKKENLSTLTKFFLRHPIEDKISWIILLIIWSESLAGLEISEKILKNFDKIIYAMITYWVISLVLIIIDGLVPFIGSIAGRGQSKLNDQLTPFVTKTLKLLAVVLGLLLMLQTIGVNVVSLVAGLGLGGLALALAAQDTAANLFGSITILVDTPFKVGDWVKVGSVEGIVEEIGFRSTRVRTFYNSLVTLPNSMVAKEIIDNLGERTYRRIRCTFNLSVDTAPATVNEFCQKLLKTVSGLPLVRETSPVVQLVKVDREGVNILCALDTTTTEGPEEILLQQRIILEAMSLMKDLNLRISTAVAP